MQRKKMGYLECVNCSETPRVSGVQLTYHKTGNTIQVVKDPEVAAEFIAKSTRCGFGTLRGMVGSWKKPTVKAQRTKKKVEVLQPKSFTVVVSKKKVEAVYKDQELGPQILMKLDTEGKDSAISMIEEEFRKMNLSPVARKQLLHVVESSSI